MGLKMKPLLDTEDAATSENVGEDKSRKRRNPFNTQRMKEEKERRQKKRARLIVRNISYKSTDEALREHFGQWGTLEDVHILKRGDGKLVGCAFVQYETINQATKAILMANNKELLGRKVFVDWALGKDEYVTKHPKEEPADKKPKVEVKEESDNEADEKIKGKKQNAEHESGKESEVDSASDGDEDGVDEDEEDEADENGVDEDAEDGADDDDADEDEKEDKKDLKTKLNVKQEKQNSNDVQQGCTVFIKNVPFDAEDDALRKVCRKFGVVQYAIINRAAVSGHSKGTAFVKFKAKESADLCLQAGTEFKMMDEVLDPHPALSRDEIKTKHEQNSKDDSGKDSRNLYLAREGLIMANSKAADGVSASDMARRHELEQVKTQVLKNLNRFVSRNRLSIHNLPLNYDNEKLKQMAISYTTFRPHECRVMREQKVTPEHPQGKSKGFGFLSFDTHQRALTALRKLNNHPSVFGTQHRPIVAFSIEDRAVHKIKEKRTERSKQNNPTFKPKVDKRKERREQLRNGEKTTPQFKPPQDDNKVKLQKHIKKLETARAAKAEGKPKPEKKRSDVEGDYVGTAAKPGTSLKMRSRKKIVEQAKDHMKHVKAEKRKQKNKKIRETHLAERKANNRPKQGHKKEKDDLRPLINRYKNMISGNEGGGGVEGGKVKKPKRTKWYAD